MVYLYTTYTSAYINLKARHNNVLRTQLLGTISNKLQWTLGKCGYLYEMELKYVSYLRFHTQEMNFISFLV